LKPPQNKWSVFLGDSEVIRIPDYVPRKAYFAKMVAKLLNSNKTIKDLTKINYEK